MTDIKQESVKDLWILTIIEKRLKVKSLVVKSWVFSSPNFIYPWKASLNLWTRIEFSSEHFIPKPPNFEQLMLRMA